MTAAALPATDVRTMVVPAMIAPMPATSDKKSDRGGGAGSSLDSLRNGSLDSLRQKSSPYVPLYENSEMTYSARQPAGRPVMPIRSVFTDVGYGSTQKITDKSDPNDKFSVRAETGKALNTLKLSQKSQSQDTRLNPGVTGWTRVEVGLYWDKFSS